MHRKLAHNPLFTEEEQQVIKNAADLMPILRKLFDAEIDTLDKKLESEDNFSLPAFNERIISLLAQRKLARKYRNLFNEVDHA